MGKKSRRNRPAANGVTSGKNNNDNNVGARQVEALSTEATAQLSSTAAAPTPVLFYPSDGPTDVELLQTESRSLQAKLDELTQLAAVDDRAGFVHRFVPVDLSDADKAAYLNDLTNASDADGHWTNIASEIAALAAGRGVDRIEGDQKTRAVFYFRHPLQQNCDREVSFCCERGEWRAEG